MTTTADFEKLEVWQKSMDLAERLLDIAEKLSQMKHYRLAQQLESCCMSVPQNIAEGKGRHSDKEFIRFLHIARGSLFEAITLLLMFKRKEWITNDEKGQLYKMSNEVGRMINGLINYLNRK